MANIIKIPSTQTRTLLPFSNIKNIKTYCTPYNFTYSMTSTEQEWGEYIPSLPVWVTPNYWMDRNFVPDSVDPPWTLIDNGTTVQLDPGKEIHTDSTGKRWATFSGSGVITHYDTTPLEEITCYMVAKVPNYSKSYINGLLQLRSIWTGSQGRYSNNITLFAAYNDEIGIYLGTQLITFPRDHNRNYHVFAFKARGGVNETGTVNVDGTSTSFPTDVKTQFYNSTFPSNTHYNGVQQTWDVKLIAFLDVAEPDDVIANNVNKLLTI